MKLRCIISIVFLKEKLGKIVIVKEEKLSMKMGSFFVKEHKTALFYTLLAILKMIIALYNLNSFFKGKTRENCYC